MSLPEIRSADEREPALARWREEHGFACDTEWNNSVGAFRLAVRVSKDVDAEWFRDPREPGTRLARSCSRAHASVVDVEQWPAPFPLARTPEEPDSQGDHVLFTHPRTWLRDLDPFARTAHPTDFAREVIPQVVFVDATHTERRWHEETDEELRERIQETTRARVSERARANVLWPELELGPSLPIGQMWVIHTQRAEDAFLTRQLQYVRPGLLEVTYSELQSAQLVPMPLEAPPDAYAYTAQQRTLAQLVGERPEALEYTAEEREAGRRALPPRIKITERTGPARPMRPIVLDQRRDRAEID